MTSTPNVGRLRFEFPRSSSTGEQSGIQCAATQSSGYSAIRVNLNRVIAERAFFAAGYKNQKTHRPSSLVLWLGPGAFSLHAFGPEDTFFFFSLSCLPFSRNTD